MVQTFEYLLKLPLKLLHFLAWLAQAILPILLYPLTPFQPFFSRVWEKHAAVILAFFAFLIATGLFTARGLREQDNYLLAAIYQQGYQEIAPRKDILIVKKDEKTSEFIGKDISRLEFASIFRFLGTPRRATVTKANEIPTLNLMEYRFGPMKAGSKPLIADTLFGVTVQASDPESLSFFRFADSFRRFPSDLWDIPTLPSLEAGQTPSLSGPEKEKWKRFFNNVLFSRVLLEVKLFPKPDVWLQIKLAIGVDLSLHVDIEAARAIGFDIMLQGEKRPEKDFDIDKVLADSIAGSRSPIVLGAMLQGQKGEVETRLSTVGSPASSTGNPTGENIREGNFSQILPHQKFIQSNTRVAYITVTPDTQGYLSFFPLFLYIPQEKRLRPSLALELAATALDAASSTPQCHAYRDAMEEEFKRILPQYLDGSFPGGLTLLDRFIPTDKQGSMYVYFIGSTKPRTGVREAIFPSVSLMECFDDTSLAMYAAQKPEQSKDFDPWQIHVNTNNEKHNTGGRICLIGTFEQSDFDFYPTPVTYPTPFKLQNQPLAGVEFHANALANILEKRYLAPPKESQTVLLLFFATLFLGFLLDLLPPAIGTLVTVLFSFLVYRFAFYLYNEQQQIFLFSPFLVSFPLTWASSTLLHYLRQRKRANMTKAMFQRFVSPDVVQYLIDNPESVKPGGQKVELTIFFSDLAGFTTISESLTPENLVLLMNEYLGEMTDILFRHGGTLDKYIGDAVMAYWNFPQSQDDAAVRACLYTLEMHQRLAELQKDWGRRGLPKAYARAGINTAHVVVGCMGSAKAQMNFTCLGDGVNLAARLEGANKEYGTLYMVSDATYQRAKHRIVGRFLDYLAVKGKKDPVKVHQLVAEIGKEPPGWDELYQLYNSGINLHLDRKWDEAIATFERILVKWPDDGPSQTYLKRCHEYKENPPPPNWDGSYHLTHK